MGAASGFRLILMDSIKYSMYFILKLVSNINAHILYKKIVWIRLQNWLGDGFSLFKDLSLRINFYYLVILYILQYLIFIICNLLFLFK